MTQTTTRAAVAMERPATKLARAITGRPYISWSQVSTMRRCPQQFSFRYIEGAKPDFVPSSLKFGGSIHSALEFHFRCKMEGLSPSMPELQHAYRLAWKEKDRDDAPIRFNKGEDDGMLDDLAQRMLGAFVESPLARPAGEIIAIEESIQATIDPDLPDVLAKVDMIHQDDQGLYLIDYKTSRSRWTEAKAAESAEQLLLYHKTASRIVEHLNLPVHLSFGVITKAKSPVAQSIPVPTDAGRVSQITAVVSQVWDAVKAGNFYANPQPMNCTTCPFKPKCPAFQGS